MVQMFNGDLARGVMVVVDTQRERCLSLKSATGSSFLSGTAASISNASSKRWTKHAAKASKDLAVSQSIIERIGRQVMDGASVTRSQTLELTAVAPDERMELFLWADRIRRRFVGPHVPPLLHRKRPVRTLPGRLRLLQPERPLRTGIDTFPLNRPQKSSNMPGAPTMPVLHVRHRHQRPRPDQPGTADGP